MITKRERDLVLQHEHVRWTGEGDWGAQFGDGPQEE